MTSPIAIAIAPSVIRLNVWPNIRISSTVIVSVSGMAVALIAVMRRWRRNSRRMMMARIAPISIASRTECTASLTSAAWSYTSLTCTPGGSDFESVAIALATLSAMAMLLPPVCRVMFTSAAGRPSPATMRT